MARRRLRDGSVVDVPDGLSKGGIQDWLMQQGATPEQVGIETIQPDPGSKSEQLVMGIQAFARDRGVPLGAAPAEGMPPADTGRVKIGQALAPMLAGTALAAVPGMQGAGAQIIGQGVLGAGIEAAREGSTPGSIAGSGLLAGGGTFGGQVAGKAISGSIVNRVQAKIGEAVAFPKAARNTFTQSMARFSQGAGGLNNVIRTQIRAINSKVGKVFGINNVDELDDVFLQEARRDVNHAYAAAAPTDDVSVAAAKELLDTIPDGAGPDILDLKKAFEAFDDTIPADRWQPVQRALRDASGSLRGNQLWGQWARRLDDVGDALNTSAADAGGSIAGLGRANQKYKMLATLEEVNSVVEAGELPAGQLVRMMGRDNFKGFGRKLTAEGAGLDRIMPEIADLLGTAKTVADFTRRTAGGSATAGREAGISTIASAGGALVKGRPLDAVGLLGTSALTRLPGIASIGTAGAGRAGGVLGSAAGQAGANQFADMVQSDANQQ